MTQPDAGRNGDSSRSIFRSSSPNLSLQIPKSKSTGNFLKPPQSAVETGRSRFSIGGGNEQELNVLKRSARGDCDNVLGVSGLRRIRRQPPSFNVQYSDDPDFVPNPLTHTQTLPVPVPTSTSTSRSVSATNLASGLTSPAIEDLHRFPSESLHSFSFARQSEDFLHSRQNILRKSVDFMRNRLNLASNPGLASAQARVSGDAELRDMVHLLRRANMLGPDTNERKLGVLSAGPVTGPADLEGKNIFEKSFTQQFDPVEEAIVSPEAEDTEAGAMPDDREGSPGLEIGLGLDNVRSPPGPDRPGLKRTYTDLTSISLQEKLMEALSQPYSAVEPTIKNNFFTSPMMPAATSISQGAGKPSVHSHSGKWSPAAQAVFRTDAEHPWTILAANDLACLVFGVTRAEVRKLGILEVIQDDSRPWLEEKLTGKGPPVEEKAQAAAHNALHNARTPLIGGRGGITARLLSKAPSRAKTSQRAQTEDGAGGYYKPKAGKNHSPTKSRGVLLCGDVIPIQKRNGSTGAATFWVMEKRGGLIWVIEEITEDVVILEIGDDETVTSTTGNVESIWGMEQIPSNTSLSTLLPHLPAESVRRTSTASLNGASLVRHCTARTATKLNIPTSVAKMKATGALRVSSFPHIAGVMVVDPGNLQITSSNAVFSAALFGHDQADGQPIGALIPRLDEMLKILTEEDDVELVDGIVIPEHSFRRVRAMLALRDGSENAANIFLRPSGLPAKHRDGSDIMVDLQMRVVRSETVFPKSDTIAEKDEDREEDSPALAVSELVYALWITYSKQLHSAGLGAPRPDHLPVSRPFTPPTQPIPRPSMLSPVPSLFDRADASAHASQVSLLSDQLPQSSSTSSIDEPLAHPPPHAAAMAHPSKTINDFIILEEMGSGAYGQVKLARHRQPNSNKMVLKYVTKRRILVDTWTRDRRLGTVPLEIHVMDYLRREGLKHPNIVEMIDFFEDDVNYYIEMRPHGIPGMDLFDYIELRSNMEEEECRSIFKQVADAIHHLHTKAMVVHRDVKDENVVLDGEGRIKLIDFGSAAYIKNGPFDVFVGTIDYAAPEVLQGKPYRGKEQDVWALGILLYTIAYKENPFYNIDEILDHPLRIPYLPFSEACIDLIRQMLDRDVDERITIAEVLNHEWLAADD